MKRTCVAVQNWW